MLLPHTMTTSSLLKTLLLKQTIRTLAIALLASVASAACATPSSDADATSGTDALSGSVQDAKLKRIKATYEVATVQDFKPLPENFVETREFDTLLALRDKRWFNLLVDGTSVVVLDALGDADVLFSDRPTSPATPSETLVFLFEQVESLSDAGMPLVSLKLSLVYRPKTGTWSGAWRGLQDVQTRGGGSGGGDAGDGG